MSPLDRSFPGGGRAGRGRGGFVWRGGGRGARGGGGRSFREDDPPYEIVEAGQVSHDCESELVCKWTITEKVPYFNAGVYLQNKKRIGKVDEILGQISDIIFTIKMDPGVVTKNFQPNDLVYIGTDKLLPLQRFTNPSGGRSSGAGGRGGGRTGGRGGRTGGRFGGRLPGGRGRGSHSSSRSPPGGRVRERGRW